ncbi:hypothetical protein M3P19_08210 [Muricauda sp. 2012CJ35-5]|uniref:Viral A-type inclusion protein n=1 Tax=Flagellimonas spongiicola TaxID=2942208 RepID=A0ABT0PRH1_9FLAO|nr:hypothetical protein [Allomuricauda spongiicola]MCL6273989.1 hypothetical protein [Allomuricauda spongiicola]
MKNYVYLTILLLTLSFSCKEKEKEVEGPSQMEQVMAIHDEVMPKMSTLGKLVGELNTKIDTTEMGLKYEAAMKDLQAAHNSMMDWMKGFGDRFDSDEILNGKALSDEKQKWLDLEEVKVKDLKEQINSSIANAEALLGKE